MSTNMLGLLDDSHRHIYQVESKLVEQKHNVKSVQIQGCSADEKQGVDTSLIKSTSAKCNKQVTTSTQSVDNIKESIEKHVDLFSEAKQKYPFINSTNGLTNVKYTEFIRDKNGNLSIFAKKPALLQQHRQNKSPSIRISQPPPPRQRSESRITITDNKIYPESGNSSKVGKCLQLDVSPDTSKARIEDTGGKNNLGTLSIGLQNNSSVDGENQSLQKKQNVLSLGSKTTKRIVLKNGNGKSVVKKHTDAIDRTSILSISAHHKRLTQKTETESNPIVTLRLKNRKTPTLESKNLQQPSEQNTPHTKRKRDESNKVDQMSVDIDTASISNIHDTKQLKSKVSGVLGFEKSSTTGPAPINQSAKRKVSSISQTLEPKETCSQPRAKKAKTPCGKDNHTPDHASETTTTDSDLPETVLSTTMIGDLTKSSRLSKLFRFSINLENYSKWKSARGSSKEKLCKQNALQYALKKMGGSVSKVSEKTKTGKVQKIVSEIIPASKFDCYISYLDDFNRVLIQGFTSSQEQEIVRKNFENLQILDEGFCATLDSQQRDQVFQLLKKIQSAAVVNNVVSKQHEKCKELELTLHYMHLLTLQ